MTPEQTTPKQTQILLLLYRFRFLNRSHIQKFLNHKSDTRISSWLKDLHQRNIIERIFPKTRETINSPAIFYLGKKSKPILEVHEKKNSKSLKRIYREKHVSEVFRNHWLCIADLYFLFEKIAKEQQSTLHFLTNTDLYNIAYLPKPLPDAYIAVQGKDSTKRYFLELIDGREKWFAVDRRMNQFISYFKANYWQSHVSYPFPKIFLVCPNTKLKKHVQEYIREKLDSEKLSMEFYIGITADIQERGLHPNTWEGI